MTFKPGESGNPSGRPKGIIDKRSELRNLLESHSKEIIEKLIERAKTGDDAAMKLCVERLIPRAKPEEGITFTLPDGSINTGNSMLQIANDLIYAVASGHLTIDEAEKFTIFLKFQRRAIEEAENKIRGEEREKYYASLNEKSIINEES